MKVRFLTISTILLLLCSCMSDEPITTKRTNATAFQASRYLSSEEACEIARKSFIDLGLHTKSRKEDGATAYLYNPSCLSRNGNDTDSLLYIVDFDKNGFAIILADRLASTNTIVISETGNFNDYYNPSFDEYILSINLNLPDSLKAIDRNYPIYSTVPSPSDDFIIDENGDHIQIVTKTETFENYIKVSWSQLSPYNDFCPPLNERDYNTINNRGQMSSYKGRCAVGCIPISIAQICSFYGKPTNWEGRELNWEILTRSPKITNITNETSQRNLSYFLSGIGKKAHVNYGITSSAKNSDALNALHSLGYQKAILTNDKQKCINSLKNGEVAYMSGVNSKRSNSGHAWVVDALKERRDIYRCYKPGSSDFYIKRVETSYYFSFNWGWGNLNHVYHFVGNPYKTGYVTKIDPDKEITDDNLEEITYDSSFCYIVDLK